MIEVKAENAFLTKNQFVYLVSKVFSDLPFGIFLDNEGEVTYMKDRKLVVNRYPTLGEIYDSALCGGHAYLTISVRVKDLDYPSGRKKTNVSITARIQEEHLNDPELLVSLLTERIGWLAMHEVQEAVSRNVGYDEIWPHGQDKWHLVPGWKQFKES